ncbi:Kelch motif-containing protein [Amycolatopsis xylanica]|uniref:Kelch motif-containing protein n=1 Tax=Amycolatopsis xylanica TaxID=589385 RepID=A0A1H3REX5_9PSEU|nr:kelch repeat-containing protein [Amycolatopsis xylanica]SDZ23768.1 Kelch motif-containing protein [Amycolatopsis xylanica]
MTGAWTVAGEVPAANRGLHQKDAMVRLDSGRVLLAGGTDLDWGAIAATAEFNPVTGAWETRGALNTGRRLHSLTLLRDGQVLAAGGIFGPWRYPTPPTATAELYDPGSGTWTPTTPMREARAVHTATLLPDGRVLVAGGECLRSPDTNGALRTAEIYDPEAKTWTPATPMTDARLGAEAAPLPDGRVLVVGGNLNIGGGYTCLAFCEIFDPRGGGTWTPTGTMTTPRAIHQLTPLPDGSVLATGGYCEGVMLGPVFDGHSLASAERYYPETGRWAPAESMPFGRGRHKAVPLPDGRVLVTGGTDEATQASGYASTIIYDPLARVWTGAGGLADGRASFAAVALADGRVLVGGGYSLITQTRSVLATVSEVFTP